MDDHLDKFPLSLLLDDTTVTSSESASLVSEASELDKPSDDDTSSKLTLRGMDLSHRFSILYLLHACRL